MSTTGCAPKMQNQIPILILQDVGSTVTGAYGWVLWEQKE